MTGPIVWTESRPFSDMPHVWEGRTPEGKRYRIERLRGKRAAGWELTDPDGKRLETALKTAKDGKKLAEDHYAERRQECAAACS